MITIDSCRSCGQHNITPFFDLGLHAFANALENVDEKPRTTYPLSLSHCPKCGLVQLDQTADPQELFSHYVWVTSTSSTAREYSKRFCDMVLARKQEMPRDSFVLEVASNDGTFLKPFVEKGYPILGVDPAQNIVDIANKDGIVTECGFWGAEVAEDVLENHGTPGIIFARNVLPHVAAVHDFLDGISACMTDKTLLVIEVHYVKPILDALHYDSIYHEHVHYFSLTSLRALLERHGLYIYDLEESPISGGSIVAFVANKPQPESQKVAQYLAKEDQQGVNSLERWQEFAKKASAHRGLFRGLLEEERKAGRKIVGYGASARSSTMLNFCGIGPDTLPIVADQNEIKQGYLTPGTRIPIESPDVVFKSLPDTVVVLAWNFLGEISRVLSDKYHFEGRILAPLPFPPRTVQTNEVTHA